MPICAICKTEKPTTKKHVHFFHAIDDWGDWRLFICDDCYETTPMQFSLHEACDGCFRPFPVDIIEKRATYFQVLTRALKLFEKAHVKLFEKLPFTTEIDRW